MQVFLSDKILRLPCHFKYIQRGHVLLDSLLRQEFINQTHQKLKGTHQATEPLN